jgi:hypothetical protein
MSFARGRGRGLVCGGHGHGGHGRPGGPSDCDCHHDPRIHPGFKRLHGPGRKGPHKLHVKAVKPSPHRRHFHVWIPGAHAWAHVEPLGSREIGPGQLTHHIGPEVPRQLMPRGWPRMHITQAPPHLHPPPPPPPGMHRLRPKMVPGQPVSKPGHWGWSAALQKHVWIGGHQNIGGIDLSTIPEPKRSRMRELMQSHGAKWAHGHTVAGVSGARSVLIPGHWAHNRSTKDWTYIEPHVDRTGNPTSGHVRYRVQDAPPAAFGHRPPHVPPLHFWPDENGVMRNARGQTPSDGPTTVTLPAHAVFARQHGISTSTSMPGTPSQFARVEQLTRVGLRRAGRAGRSERLAAEQSLIAGTG